FAGPHRRVAGRACGDVGGHADDEPVGRDDLLDPGGERRDPRADEDLTEAAVAAGEDVRGAVEADAVGADAGDAAVDDRGAAGVAGPAHAFFVGQAEVVDPREVAEGVVGGLAVVEVPDQPRAGWERGEDGRVGRVRRGRQDVAQGVEGVLAAALRPRLALEAAGVAHVTPARGSVADEHERLVYLVVLRL